MNKCEYLEEIASKTSPNQAYYPLTEIKMCKLVQSIVHKVGRNALEKF